MSGFTTGACLPHCSTQRWHWPPLEDGWTCLANPPEVCDCPLHHGQLQVQPQWPLDRHWHTGTDRWNTRPATVCEGQLFDVQLFTLHLWANLFSWTPNQLFWEALSHAAFTAQLLPFMCLSGVACNQVFIKLTQLRQNEVNEYIQALNKQQDGALAFVKEWNLALLLTA